LLRVIFSWVGVGPDSPIYGFVHEITEPILAPIRQIVPRIGMIDLSPMLASFLLFFVIQAAGKLN
jgi:YggT family protein